MNDNKKQKIFPGLKLKSPEEGAQGVIEFILPPEIVFNAVSVVFQDIVVFVLYLPTGAGALRKRGNMLWGYRFIGYPTVFIRDCTPSQLPYHNNHTPLLCAIFLTHNSMIDYLSLGRILTAKTHEGHEGFC
jgi:hypothetical protein